MQSRAGGSIFTGRPLTRGERVIVALTIGIGAALAALLVFLSAPAHVAKDFTYAWRAAHALLRGMDPYAVIRPTGPYPFESQFMYPLTAAVAAVPFAPFAAPVAGALFVGVGTALLAYLLGRGGMGRLWVFASAPFAVSVALGQWPPLLMAAALATPLAWLLTCKPTLGAALMAYRPDARAFAACAVFVLATIAMRPDWPLEWLAATRSVARHEPPVLHPLGLVPLLALLRWRRPEARLVAAMVLVPQNLYWYDQLPLWLAARTGRSAFALTASSWMGWGLTALSCPVGRLCGPQAEPWVLTFLYLPATAIVLLDAEGLAALKRWWGAQRARRGGADTAR